MQKMYPILAALATLCLTTACAGTSQLQKLATLNENDKICLTLALPGEPLPENPSLLQRTKYNNSPRSNLVTGTFLDSDGTVIRILKKKNTDPESHPLDALLKIEKNVRKEKKYLKPILLNFAVGTAAIAILLAVVDPGGADDVVTDDVTTGAALLGGVILGGIPGILFGTIYAAIPHSEWIEIPVSTLKR